MVINGEVVEGRAKPLYIYSDRRGDVGHRRLRPPTSPDRSNGLMRQRLLTGRADTPL